MMIEPDETEPDETEPSNSPVEAGAEAANLESGDNVVNAIRRIREESETVTTTDQSDSASEAAAKFEKLILESDTKALYADRFNSEPDEISDETRACQAWQEAIRDYGRYCTESGNAAAALTLVDSLRTEHRWLEAGCVCASLGEQAPIEELLQYQPKQLASDDLTEDEFFQFEQPGHRLLFLRHTLRAFINTEDADNYTQIKPLASAFLEAIEDPKMKENEVDMATTGAFDIELLIALLDKVPALKDDIESTIKKLKLPEDKRLSYLLALYSQTNDNDGLVRVGREAVVSDYTEIADKAFDILDRDNPHTKGSYLEKKEALYLEKAHELMDHRDSEMEHMKELILDYLIRGNAPDDELTAYVDETYGALVKKDRLNYQLEHGGVLIVLLRKAYLKFGKTEKLIQLNEMFLERNVSKMIDDDFGVMELLFKQGLKDVADETYSVLEESGELPSLIEQNAKIIQLLRSAYSRLEEPEKLAQLEGGGEE